MIKYLWYDNAVKVDETMQTCNHPDDTKQQIA